MGRACRSPLVAGITLMLACGDAPVEMCGPASGVVANVVDGDTVDLASGVRIRYLLVDTPEVARHAGETSECFGEEAKQINSQWVLGQTVGLEYDEECEDRFDRSLAYVYDRRREVTDMVNYRLIERGYAKLLVIEPNVLHADVFARAESDAKDRRDGMWSACP